MLLNIYPQGFFYIDLLHNIMVHRITKNGIMEHELWFFIGKSKARFSKREFCLVTRLKFGLMTDVFSRPYEVIPKGIHDKDRKGEDNLNLQQMLNRFRDSNL
ncbi:Uncharacterized protein TCM_035321 [Theobroma cacao]|uniref:DUF1985 domain-containing protein n=1 Tax=Theobroma cacao TaxID=3641 RepID=A0A061FPR1_THECC|nr:Uncharacterized protein TCM_035321 [Theobroma cacao]